MWDPVLPGCCVQQHIDMVRSMSIQHNQCKHSAPAHLYWQTLLKCFYFGLLQYWYAPMRHQHPVMPITLHMHQHCTQLVNALCSQYKRGELILKSDNLSSLAILREFVTKEATMQKVRIQLSFKLEPRSIGHSISSLWPRMKRHMEHSRENLLLEALQVCASLYASR